MSEGADGIADAVRFRVMNRLASGMRHDLLGTFNTIALAAQLAERQLAKDPPDLARMAEHLKRIQSRSQDAATAYTRVVAWLDPAANPVIRVDEGVEQCMSMLHSELSLGGVRAQVQVDEASGGRLVQRMPLQYMLAATVLAWIDEEAALALQIHTRDTVSAVEFSISNVGGKKDGAPTPGERLVTWAAVETLSRANDISLRRSEAAVSVTLPLAS